VRRFRKSYFAEPGARIAHPGLIQDLKAIDPLAKCGVTTTSSQHVADVLTNPASTSDFQRINQQRVEANYASQKREPLGKSYSRGHVLPAQMQRPDFAFGVTGTFGDSARELLYPSTVLNNKQDEDLYKRSHGSLAPGEQKNRQYSWGAAQIDPTKYRFGDKSVVPGSDGVGAAHCLNPEMDDAVTKQVVTAKQVEDLRSTFDQLGKPRHLGASANNLARDHVFGFKPSKEPDNARDCIQGQYSEEEQQPDKDLGRAVNFGWKNTSVETRSFGVPSVRCDIPMPARRSIADAQNYGDDATSKELLYPEEFASSGVRDDEFATPRDRTFVRSLFEKIGYQLQDAHFAMVWKHASLGGKYTPHGCVSIAEFRDALNDYLEAEDNGPAALDTWRQRLERL
jgi:EF-hand domain-containing family member B